MINSKKILIATFLLALLFLISCKQFDRQASKQVDYNITKGSNYTYTLQDGMTNIDCETLSTESVNYYFETDIFLKEEIYEFINNVETLRCYLENEFELSFSEPLSVFVSKKNDFSVDYRKVYLYDLDLVDEDVTIIFIQSLLDEKINYGLSYGLACYVNEVLYKKPIKHRVTIADLKKYYSINENLIFMDLTVPVFETVYFNEKQSKYAYPTAYYFVKDLIERKGLEYAVNLLKNSSKLDIAFDIEFTNEKNIWLESIAATKRCEAPLIPMRFKVSTKSLIEDYPYIIYTPSTISRFIPNIKFKDEGIVMDYTYVKHYLTMYEQDVLALKKYLYPYFNSVKYPIDCYFGGKFESNLYSRKDSYNNDKIRYYSPLDAGVHEYAHYLTSTNGIPLWLSEGLAEYCNYYLVDKDVYRMVDELNRIYGKDSLRFIEYYIEDNDNSQEIGDKYYIKVMAQYNAYLNSNNINSEAKNIAWYYPDKKDEEGADLSYIEAASLVNYLIKTYGEEKFFNVYKGYLDTSLVSTYGKTFNELREEWLVKLNNLFSNNEDLQ